MGFAIPVDIVRSSVDQIIRFGRVIRPILGISFAPDQSSEQVGPSQLIPAAHAADIVCAAGLDTVLLLAAALCDRQADWQAEILSVWPRS